MGDSLSVKLPICIVGQSSSTQQFPPVQSKPEVQKKMLVVQAGIGDVVWEGVRPLILKYILPTVIAILAWRFFIPQKIKNLIYVITTAAAGLYILKPDLASQIMGSIPGIKSIAPESDPMKQLIRVNKRICDLPKEIEEAIKERRRSIGTSSYDRKDSQVEKLQAELRAKRQELSELEAAVCKMRGDKFIPANGYVPPCY